MARTDDVTAADAAGDTIYLLSHKNAPTFQVLSVKAGQPLASAKVLVPAEKDRVIDSIHAASDALYVLARHGAYSLLLRVPHASGKIEEVALPFKGHIGEAFTDPRQPGITIGLESFVVPPTTFAYDPAKKTFADLKLGVTCALRLRPLRNQRPGSQGERRRDGAQHAGAPERREGSADRSHPGVRRPTASRSSPISASARQVSSKQAAPMRRATCAAAANWAMRGASPERTRTSRTPGATSSPAPKISSRAATRPKDKLFIFGGSAGGITMGRALTERPDLFAGVIAMVPGANTLRSEFQPSGPLNIPEFGTITTEEGFKNLYEMDTIQHVRPAFNIRR